MAERPELEVPNLDAIPHMGMSRDSTRLLCRLLDAVASYCEGRGHRGMKRQRQLAHRAADALRKAAKDLDAVAQAYTWTQP